MATSDDTVEGHDDPKRGRPVAIGSGSLQGTRPRSPILDTGFDSARPDPPLPERIRQYRIERVLGRGGFGMVYLAHDEVLQRRVAIKVPHRDRLSTAAARAQFLHEAQLAAGLRHPNVVVVYDIGVDEEDRCYIVYEYLAGATLAERMRDQPYSSTAAVQLAIEIASALDAAHRQSLVHRDLKPGNILLDEEGHARLTDFGLAVDDVTQREQAGVVSGTPAYMAPEQARGETHLLDGRTDFWALGVILYELLARRRPFLGRSSEEVFEEIRAREPKPLRQLAPQVDRALEKIVMTCLQKDPAQRFTTAADLIDELRQWQRVTDDELPSTIDLPPLSAAKPAAQPARPRYLFPAIAILVGLLLVLVGIAGWLNLFGGGDRGSGAGSGDLPTPFKKLSPGEIKQLTSYPLLTAADYDRRVWPWREGTAQFLPQPHLDLITLSTIDMGLVSLGSTQARGYKLQFQIDQSPWAGNCGVFWGLHKAPDGAWLCQFLMLRRRQDMGKWIYYWERERLRASSQNGTSWTVDTQAVGQAHDVEHPSYRPHGLEITIRDGLPEASWNALPLTNLPPEPELELVDAGEYVGEFGVLTSASQTNFRNGRVLLLDLSQR